MKMKITTILVSMGLGMASGLAVAANQGSGTVTFTGSIIDAPCSIAADSEDQTVELGSIANAALKNGGTSTPRPFNIVLENCDALTAKTVTTTFSGAASKAQVGNLAITGSASGASIAIKSGDTLVKLGQPAANQQIQDGETSLSFSAYLQGDGGETTENPNVVIPGEFSSIANFTLAYQ